MNISKRLKAIINLIPNNQNVWDVGCDHGLLDIYLSIKCPSIKINGSDISSSSIKQANYNAKKYNAGPNLSFILSDGCKNLFIQKEDVLVITGMGGKLIVELLLKASCLCDTLVIGAQKNLYYLRKSIIAIGYYIEKEDVIFDKRWYCLIRFKRGTRQYSEEDYKFGPFAKYNRDYMLYEYQKLRKIEKQSGKQNLDLLSIKKVSKLDT